MISKKFSSENQSKIDAGLKIARERQKKDSSADKNKRRQSLFGISTSDYLTPIIFCAAICWVISIFLQKLGVFPSGGFF